MEEVYYLCYGSNLSEQRFREYLAGFSKESAVRPLNSGVVEIPHKVFYAGYSGRWKGGIAYLDIDQVQEKPVPYRVYGMSRGEFEELFSRENGFFTEAFPWGKVLASSEPVTVDGAYFYGRVVRLGSIGGVPVLTFTNEDSLAQLESGEVAWPRLSDPGEPYLEVIGRGRQEMKSLPVWTLD